MLLQVAAGLGCARGRDREAAPSATQAAGEEGIWVFGVNRQLRLTVFSLRASRSIDYPLVTNFQLFGGEICQLLS